VSQAPPAGGESDDDRDRSVLEEEREFFLRSLEDLEAERAAGDIDEVDYLSLKDDYTVRAAQILRRLAYLDGQGPDPDATPLPPEPAAADTDAPAEPDDEDADRPPPRGKRLLIGVAVLLIVGGITWAVAGYAGVRLPGEEVSGGNKTQQASREIVKAATAEGTGNATQALEDYEAAVKEDPGNAEALTGEGSILVTVGESGGGTAMVTQGIVDLGEAELADPNYGIPYAYRGLGYYYEADYTAAVQQLDAYVANTPAKTRQSSILSYLAKAKAKASTAH
jgi:tetratricopeptide (TPR) repeat protein